MAPLFLFGTLQHEPLLRAVLGATDHLTISPAQLPGFTLHRVAEGAFPMLVPTPGGQVPGLLLDGWREEDRTRLDFYEAAFGYRPRTVALAGGQAASVYLPKEDLWTPSGDWSLRDWARDWGPLSVIAAGEVMGYRGRKTPAEVAAMFPMIRSRAWSRLNAGASRHGEGTLPGRVEVIRRTRSHAGYFALDSYRLRHERFDGGLGEEVRREVFLASDAALVLPYDPVRDRVLVVEQMRMGPLARGDATLWQLEPIAGRLDPGEDPQSAARREALEEAGLALGTLEPVAEAYCSPGNSSEFYFIYIGIADLPDSAAGTGGLDAEDEDIRSHLIGFDQLMEMCGAMKIANAPLVTAAYWLAHHRARLRRSNAGVE